MLALGRDRVLALHHALGPGVAGGAVLTFAQLLLVPNLVVWTAAVRWPARGSRSAPGTGSTSRRAGSGRCRRCPCSEHSPGPAGCRSPRSPCWPCRSPRARSAGVLVARSRPASWRVAVLDVAGAAVLAGAALAALAWLSGGPAGPGLLAVTGPTPCSPARRSRSRRVPGRRSSSAATGAGGCCAAAAPGCADPAGRVMRRGGRAAGRAAARRRPRLGRRHHAAGPARRRARPGLRRRSSAVGADRSGTAGLERAARPACRPSSCTGRDFADRAGLGRGARPKAVAAVRAGPGGARRVHASCSAPASSTSSGAGTVNTHPALLPAFPGMHGVRDALAHGVKVTGAT